MDVIDYLSNTLGIQPIADENGECYKAIIVQLEQQITKQQIPNRAGTQTENTTNNKYSIKWYTNRKYTNNKYSIKWYTNRNTHKQQVPNQVIHRQVIHKQ